MCWSLSPVIVKTKKREKAWAIEKKCGHMKVQVLKKKKKIYGHMNFHEKKDNHAFKKIFYVGREIIQKEFPFRPSQSMHVHILI